jgi:hypothetical protein
MMHLGPTKTIPSRGIVWFFAYPCDLSLAPEGSGEETMGIVAIVGTAMSHEIEYPFTIE